MIVLFHNGGLGLNFFGKMVAFDCHRIWLGDVWLCGFFSIALKSGNMDV